MRPLTRLVGAVCVSVVSILSTGCLSAEQASDTDVPPLLPATSPATAPQSAATSTTTPSSSSGQPNIDLSSRIIVLDPGHNGSNFEHVDEISRMIDIGNGSKACNTTGTETDDGYSEAQVNWEIALLVSDRLTSLGAEVLMTRTDNEGWGPCLDERAAIGNEAGAHAVISIHADGGPSNGRGFHVIAPQVVPGLTDDIAEDSLLLAEAMTDALSRSGIPPSNYVGVDGITRRDDLGGLNLSNVPIVFVELGNMRNRADAAILTDPSGQVAIADAIVDGIIRALSID